MRPCVYILASGRVGTLYVGVTSDLARRVWQHKNGVVEGHEAVRRAQSRFAEFHDTMEEAILREKRLKKWRRAWKIRLIEEANPEWLDLFDQIGA